MGLLFTKLVKEMFLPLHRMALESNHQVICHGMPLGSKRQCKSKIKMFMEEEHKVIVVGLDNAGKTTILYQLSMNEVIHTRNGSK